ncbi:hypothetical protein [Spiroplasma cantharicola]|uniref:Lipoprotein n=1 Tax=Spiroplasma cantharicola TaxID=362837 RepID=A0A0M4JIC3_9MOLU|nr:hypothetical protein [Spiroplasma cantharicola]ALD66329.1 hypothetical protein SCANT_v1c04230 [Spiroplasma cantharicola]
MKKKLLLSYLISAIIPTSLIVGCGPTFVVKPEENISWISQELIEKVINTTVQEFETYLLETYGSNENPKKNFYDFEDDVKENNMFNYLFNKLETIYKINKNKFLDRKKYPKDDIKVFLKQKEIKNHCEIIESGECFNWNFFKIDDKLFKVGEYDFGNFNIKITSSKTKFYFYKKNLIFPIRNYWIDKKNFTDLWERHNSTNEIKIQNISSKDDYFTIPNFEKMEPEGLHLKDQFDFITHIEDIFGNWYWDIKKTSSFIYSMFSDRLRNIVPITSRYNARNFYQKNPKVNFCKINPKVNLDEDSFHYCAQLEKIKSELNSLNSENNEIEISFNVPLNKKYLGILKPENMKSSFKMYFGKIKFLEKNKYKYYSVND